MSMETIRPTQLFFERLIQKPRAQRTVPEPLPEKPAPEARVSRTKAKKIVAALQAEPPLAATEPLEAGTEPETKVPEKTPVKPKTVRRFTGRLQSFGRALRPYFRHFGIFAYVAILLVAGQLALYWRPVVGVYVEAAALTALIGFGLLYDKGRPLLISAAILPVAMMVTLSLSHTSVLAQTTVFYNSLLLMGLIYRFIFTLDFPVVLSRLNLRGYAMVLGLMLVIGQLLGALGYVFLRHHYTFGSTPLPLIAVAAVIFAITEEVFFRGLIQQQASRIMHPLMAALLSVILYTFTSFGHITLLAPLYALILGSVLSFIYYRKPNVLLTITVNATAKLVYIGLMAAFIFR
jgi:membrane protease YdiL (CAAX protease family)